ncbi:hypothetical protein GCM10027059_47420 [Myceligenerans halotolerans]
MNDDERTALSDSARTGPVPSEPADRPRPARRRVRDVIASREVIAAVIVGALTVASTIAGAVASNWLEVRQTVTEKSSGELSAEVENLERLLAASQDDANTLQDQVDALRDENARLAGGSSSDTTASDTAASDPGSTPAPDVFREDDHVAISVGSCLDLDSKAGNWDLVVNSYGLDYQLGRDLCYTTDSLEILAIRLVDAEPTLADCASQTLVKGKELGPRDIRDGLWLCGQTDEERTVSVGILEATDDDITMRIRVWK